MSGSLEFFAQPKWYRGGEGEWAKVDPVVVPVGDPEATREEVVLAASGVGFVAEFARSDVGVRLEFEGRSVQVVPRGRPGVVPELDPESDTVVWYRDVFDSVDLRYTVTSTGLKEDFVVRSPAGFDAAGDFTVDVVSEGVLVASSLRGGSLVFDWDGNGTTAWDGDVDGPKFEIPPPVVTDARVPRLTASGRCCPSTWQRTVQHRRRIASPVRLVCSSTGRRSHVWMRRSSRRSSIRRSR